MDEQKLIAKGPIFEYIKQYTKNINIANNIKEEIIDYLNAKLQTEIELLCNWFLDVTQLQGKRTIQENEWHFILKQLKD